MTIIYRSIIILASVIVLSQSTQVCAQEEDVINRKLAYYLQCQTQRVARSKMNTFMDVLNVRPGMTILDVGTGTGQYAYRFAEELKGEGELFVTDIDIDFINYVNKEKDKRGFSNLYPVLVKKDGVDEFYSKHRYDLILNFHVFFNMHDRVNYFKEMKEYLNKDGRLVVTNGMCIAPFSLNDFSDFAGLIKDLASEPETGPFYKGLSLSTQKFIKQTPEGEPDRYLKEAIVADLNRMRLDDHFRYAFLMDKLTFKKEVSFLSEDEKNFASWILLRLDRDLSSDDTRQMYKLNKLLIVQRFRKYMHRNAGILPYESQNECRKVMQTKEELKEAGFKFEKEYNIIPFEYSLVFSPN